jgi:hypothetical protein
MHAPFAAEVERKVRPKSRKPRKTSALNPLLVAVRFEATASCQRFREFAFRCLFGAQFDRTWRGLLTCLSVRTEAQRENDSASLSG